MQNDVFILLHNLYNEYQRNTIPSSRINQFTEEETHALVWLLNSDYMFISPSNGGYAVITGKGEEAYINEKLTRKDQLEKQKQDEARKEAERLSDRAYTDQQTQKHFRHDWRIHVFDAVVGFVSGIIADYFFDIVGNAVRLWRFLSEWLQSLSPP